MWVVVHSRACRTGFTSSRPRRLLPAFTIRPTRLPNSPRNFPARPSAGSSCRLGYHCDGPHATRRSYLTLSNARDRTGESNTPEHHWPGVSKSAHEKTRMVSFPTTAHNAQGASRPASRRKDTIRVFNERCVSAVTNRPAILRLIDFFSGSIRSDPVTTPLPRRPHTRPIPSGSLPGLRR